MVGTLRYSLRRFNQLLVTPNGRKWIGYGCGYLGLSCMFGAAAYNSMLMRDQINTYYQLFEQVTEKNEKGKSFLVRRPVAVPVELEAMGAEEFVNTEFFVPHTGTLENLRILNFFHTRYFAVKAKGQIGVRQGTYLGLPYNLRFRSKKDLMDNWDYFAETVLKPFGVLQTRLDELRSNAPAFDKFVDSLILSDTAKRFAVHQELQKNKWQSEFLWESLLGALCFFGTYLTTSSVNKLFKLHNRSRRLRVLNYAITIPLTIGGFLLAREFTMDLRERVALGLTAEKGGEALINGGVEYYQKQIELNKTLRRLAPANLIFGRFDAHGDPVRFFGYRDMPLEFRLNKLKNILLAREQEGAADSKKS